MVRPLPFIREKWKVDDESQEVPIGAGWWAAYLMLFLHHRLILCCCCCCWLHLGRDWLESTHEYFTSTILVGSKTLKATKNGKIKRAIAHPQAIGIFFLSMFGQQHGWPDISADMCRYREILTCTPRNGWDDGRCSCPCCLYLYLHVLRRVMSELLEPLLLLFLDGQRNARMLLNVLVDLLGFD